MTCRQGPFLSEERPLAPGPPPEFVARLKQLGVSPLSVGRSIVATWKPQETKVLEVIRELGLELQIIFNKDAVMTRRASMSHKSAHRSLLVDLI